MEYANKYWSIPYDLEYHTGRILHSYEVSGDVIILTSLILENRRDYESRIYNLK